MLIDGLVVGETSAVVHPAPVLDSRCVFDAKDMVGKKGAGATMARTDPKPFQASTLHPISRHQLSAAAHERLPHANPLSTEQMAELVALAASRSPRNAIDIGCGSGSFSIGLASAAAVDVRAIDVNAISLDRARAAAERSTLKGRVEFLERPVQADAEGRFDLVVCIGSSGAAGSPKDAIGLCDRLLASGGTLVFAELVWTQKPDPEFLAFLGIEESFYWTASAGRELFRQAGFEIAHECEASRQSWDHYESEVHSGRLRFAGQLPIGPATEVKDRAAAWYAMYSRHGARCLGFVAWVAHRAEVLGC